VRHASSFNALVGTSPLDHLPRWRIRLTARAPLQSTVSISSIAFTHRYESEAAVTNAFKRVIGTSPKISGGPLSLHLGPANWHGRDTTRMVSVAILKAKRSGFSGSPASAAA
jgi:AraC-like DNA-binding protein